jgi:prolyl-tRNA editing enzyme YbaK/EbsC (Cys-tRNA(Pro) deacylase)
MHSTHPNVQLVARRLTELGASGQVVELTDPAPTAATAAAQLGCEIGAIANSLVFAAVFEGRAEKEPVLVLTSGAHRVDTAKVATLIGAVRLSRATPEFVKEATGQTIGGVAPVGHPKPLRTLVDEWLRDHETVWAAAGHAHTVFPTTYEELLAMTGGTPAQVA